MSSKRFQRPTIRRERRKLYVIATEGKKTEHIYFSMFKGEDFRKNVKVHILPPKSDWSAPQHVLNRLRDHVRKVGIEDGDELWVVVDVDSWGDDVLRGLCHDCTKEGYHVAISNPCFELWLLLHQKSPPTPAIARDCEKELVTLLGRYEKSGYDVTKLVPHIQLAINHARRLDDEPDALWPTKPSSRVYRLVEKLIQ